ncbi:hypothetical protein MBLNU230_g5819t1 [Neophaeotheca triangularis]
MLAFTLLASAALTSTAHSAALTRRANTGEATFYGGNVQGGMCSFSTYNLPRGLYGTALSDSNWDNSANCGGCVRVSGPNGNAITAMIVDQCPGCGTNHLDLFQDAFEELAPAQEGIIDISWDYVECPVSSPLQIHMKEGVSPYWFSAQVVGANMRVQDLQVSTDGGRSWQSGLNRMEYNFFENSSGFGSDTVSVKAIAEDGSTVVVNDIAVQGGNTKTAGSNF